jgi:outer membrane PBP1 activator LpoA protein
LLRRHSLCRVATALKLDYYSLKKRAQHNAASPSASGLTFVEVPAAAAPAVPGKQCFCDLRHRDGNTMRLHLIGFDAADLEGLARRFWDAR